MVPVQKIATNPGTKEHAKPRNVGVIRTLVRVAKDDLAMPGGRQPGQPNQTNETDREKPSKSVGHEVVQL